MKLAEYALLGHIGGDICGSVYERRPVTDGEVELFREGAHFTDDTVLTVAAAEAHLGSSSLADQLRSYTTAYPMRGYGKKYLGWAWGRSERGVNSYGVGAAMRILPTVLANLNSPDWREKIETSAAVTHTHPNALQAALEVAEATRLALAEALGAGRPDQSFGWRSNAFGPSGFQSDALLCARPAIAIGLSASSWSEAVESAIKLRADADTQAAIAGGIAAIRCGLSGWEIQKISEHIPTEFLSVIRRFSKGVDF